MFRLKVIAILDVEIICITETHLKHDYVIDVLVVKVCFCTPNYTITEGRALGKYSFSEQINNYDQENVYAYFITYTIPCYNHSIMKTISLRKCSVYGLLST